MPAQNILFLGNTAGSANDLKQKATDQFERIADKAPQRPAGVARASIIHGTPAPSVRSAPRPGRTDGCALFIRQLNVSEQHRGAF